MVNLLKRLRSKLTKGFPNATIVCLKSFYILAVEFEHGFSARYWTTRRKDGQPRPWYTYSAIEYLQQLDFSDAAVFEYGAGVSTLFWAMRAKTVRSVDHDPSWIALLSPQLPENATCVLREEEAAYRNAIDENDMLYDVIVVDGQDRSRCAVKAVPRLAPKGIIIVDNADWYPDLCARLRDSGLLEVDMTGFGPINAYTSTTSFFFDRQFDRRPSVGIQPRGGPGCVRQIVRDFGQTHGTTQGRRRDARGPDSGGAESE